MGRRHRVLILVLALACAALLASCGRSSSPTQVLAVAQTLTSVHVVRVNTIPQNHIAPYDTPFDVMQTDVAKVRDLYTLMATLKPMPPGTYSCPADLGVRYDVTFYSGATTAITATIEATGCGILTLGNTSHWWAPVETFWSEVANDLGVPESALTYVPPATTPAPTATPIPLAAITSLRVERVSAFASNDIAAYTRTLTNSARAQAVYALLEALPPLPSGGGTCPANTRVAYEFTIDAGTQTVLSATVDEACGLALVGEGMRWWKSVPNFYPQLAADLGVPVSALTPAPSSPTGQYAPIDLQVF